MPSCIAQRAIILVLRVLQLPNFSSLCHPVGRKLHLTPVFVAFVTPNTQTKYFFAANLGSALTFLHLALVTSLTCYLTDRNRNFCSRGDQGSIHRPLSLCDKEMLPPVTETRQMPWLDTGQFVCRSQRFHGFPGPWPHHCMFSCLHHQPPFPLMQ